MLGLAVTARRQSYTLDKSALHHRATYKDKTTFHTQNANGQFRVLSSQGGDAGSTQGSAQNSFIIYEMLIFSRVELQQQKSKSQTTHDENNSL